MRRLAITIGDPTGIGPEITAKALQRIVDFPGVHCNVIGDIKGLQKTALTLGLTLPHLPSVTYNDISAQQPGDVAYKSIDSAVQLIAAHKVDALVTGPISKKHLQEAGHEAHGHTEILEMFAQSYFDFSGHAEMLFVNKKFRLLLLTRHLALSEVPRALEKSGAVSRPLKTLIAFLRHQLNISDPRIAILGVNPHAGEIGGDEELKYLQPVIHAVNAIGASTLVGPLPADGFFRGFQPQDSGYDAVVASYHDQGLIPFKIFAGYEAVNVTIGLPFLRTSVSHGTASDIVGQNLAREDSLLAAMRTALDVLATPSLQKNVP